MNEEATSPSIWKGCDTTPRDWRNTKRMLWTILAWAVTFLGASWAIKKELLPAGPAGWAVALVPSIVAVFVVMAFARFIREADELQRLIQLQGLGLGFAAGWLAITGYPLLERLGAPEIDIGGYMTVMAFSYAIGTVIAWRRYR